MHGKWLEVYKSLEYGIKSNEQYSIDFCKLRTIRFEWNIDLEVVFSHMKYYYHKDNQSHRYMLQQN